MTHYDDVPECVECGSKEVAESKHLEGLYECLECGEYFEWEDPQLHLLQERRHRALTKEIFAR